MNIVCDLEKAIADDGQSIVSSFETGVVLSHIDKNWKEHLKSMDDLKQSVQSAVYEQKDPLIIYKFEGFELFKRFIAKVNKDTVSFLTSAQIPVKDPDQVKEAQAKRSSNDYSTNKEESRSLLSGNNEKSNDGIKSEPIKSNKIYGRNSKVSVRYENGSVIKDVKYKKVESDLNDEKCVIIND